MLLKILILFILFIDWFLKQTFSDNIVEILAGWINRNHFLKLITLFVQINRENLQLTS